MIKYPFELNLEKYTANHHNNNDNDNNKQQPSPIYELYAVVNHQGRPAWGHYTAFARSSHSNEFGMFFYFIFSKFHEDNDYFF